LRTTGARSETAPISRRLYGGRTGIPRAVKN
jgi:hypothetical protein